ncbi:MAG: hypothetical protein AMXMBFR13_02590 [Phycisphaerae bacterium]
MLTAFMHFTKYIKTAFLNRWNLLVFLGALGFSMLSGHPDVVAPLVLAGEVAYLGLLASHDKFQRYVDAQEAKTLGSGTTTNPQDTLKVILRSLPPQAVERFEALRSRCLELRQIAMQIKDPGGAGGGLGFDRSQVESLDRLLWIYLRLLYTQSAVERFLRKTSEPAIREDIANLESRLARTNQIDDEIQRQKFVKAIEDNLSTCRDRLANYEKARSNHEFMQLEIDRLENKIRSLSELAVNRHEPDFISAQVDQVASSMLQTERTMNELQFLTGLTATEEQPPALLQTERA